MVNVGESRAVCNAGAQQMRREAEGEREREREKARETVQIVAGRQLKRLIRYQLLYPQFLAENQPNDHKIRTTRKPTGKTIGPWNEKSFVFYINRFLTL